LDPIKILFVTVGLPSCAYLFYASIKKGIAETEEDDAKFQRGNY